jgi:hypothetical protein
MRSSAIRRFLGDKKMRGELGDEYVTALRKCYEGRVPGGADLVTYWFEKARAQIAAGKCKAAGLVATNSIRGGANRKVLDRIVETTRNLRCVELTSHGSTKARRCGYRWCALALRHSHQSISTESMVPRVHG